MVGYVSKFCWVVWTHKRMAPSLETWTKVFRIFFAKVLCRVHSQSIIMSANCVREHKKTKRLIFDYSPELNDCFDYHLREDSVCILQKYSLIQRLIVPFYVPLQNQFEILYIYIYIYIHRKWLCVITSRYYWSTKLHI